MTERIEVHANPKCRYCLGGGRSQSIIADITPICGCVTGQLRIIIAEKDYSIPGDQRVEPPEPELVMRNG
jgi:hypothetical protein